MKESIFSSGLKIGRFEESSMTVSYHRILYIMKYANEILHMICKLSGYVYDLTSRISNRLSSYRLYIWTQTVLDSGFSYAKCTADRTLDDEVKVFCKITIFPVHQRAHFVITIRFYLRPVIWRNKLKLNKVSTISCLTQITLYGTNRSGIIEMYKIKCGTNDIGSRQIDSKPDYENGELFSSAKNSE